MRCRVLLVRVQPESFETVNVAQQVRAPGCDPGGYGFDSRRSPFNERMNCKEKLSCQIPS